MTTGISLVESKIQTRLADLYYNYLIEQDNSELGKSLALLKSNCLEHLIEVSKGETRDAIQASKYLLEFTLDSKRGRPSKEEILLETKKIIDNNVREDQDYALYKSWKE